MMFDASHDPTKTAYLRKRMRTVSDRRWHRFASSLREALINRDMIGLRSIGQLPHGDKEEQLAAWIGQELNQKVFGLDGSWTRPFIRSAVEIARRHAHSYTPSGVLDPSRAAQMEDMTVNELRRIVGYAQQQITQVVTDAMRTESTPTSMMGAVTGVIQAMRKRTWAMGDWMIAKTHATTTLSIFQHAGVKRVGIIPEHKRSGPKHDHAMDAKRKKGPGSRSRKKAPSARTIRRIRAAQRSLEEQFPKGVDVLTAEDEFVCIVCEDISEGGPYELDEAEDLIPAHVYCRCAFVPAGTLEDAACLMMSESYYLPQPRY